LVGPGSTWRKTDEANVSREFVLELCFACYHYKRIGLGDPLHLCGNYEMKKPKPECVMCGIQNKSIRLYLCSKNLLKQKIKTNYCKKCARNQGLTENDVVLP
jgi:hypothetical protein